MDRSVNTDATQTPGPPSSMPDHRRGSARLRVWSPDQSDATLDGLEASLRQSARAIREMRCLIDRLGAIPMHGSD